MEEQIIWKPPCLTEIQSQFETINKKATLYEIERCRATIPFLPENRGKNRYESLFSYDDFRVVLNKTDSLGDYINAAWVSGYYASGEQDPHRFICTQGPLENTIDDFWRMVFETRSHLIFMLSREVEGVTKKVATYWPYPPSGPLPLPGETEQQTLLREKAASTNWSSFHPTSVTVVPLREKLVSDGQIVLREFSVSAAYGSEESNLELDPINVVQVHFYAWPDGGVPDSPEPLLELLNICQAEETEPRSSFNLTQEQLTSFDILPVPVCSGKGQINNGPVVVHCSAGVGRTGVFVAVHRMFREIDIWKKEGKRIADYPFDFERIVSDMRMCRKKMVGDISQYEFCFETVSFALSKMK